MRKKQFPANKAPPWWPIEMCWSETDQWLCNKRTITSFHHRFNFRIYHQQGHSRFLTSNDINLCLSAKKMYFHIWSPVKACRHKKPTKMEKTNRKKPTQPRVTNRFQKTTLNIQCMNDICISLSSFLLWEEEGGWWSSRSSHFPTVAHYNNHNIQKQKKKW